MRLYDDNYWHPRTRRNYVSKSSKNNEPCQITNFIEEEIIIMWRCCKITGIKSKEN
jgi:hypothetical protein